MSLADDLAKVIWTASRADESTISATGADHVAAAVLAAGYRKPIPPKDHKEHTPMNSELGDRIRSEAWVSDRPEQRYRLNAIAADVDRLKRGAETLGETVEQQCRMVLEITGAYDLIGEDGDGDWGAVWDRLYALRGA